MRLEKENFEEAVKKAIENKKERKFEQSLEMIITLKNIDLKKPENRVKLQITLPKGRGKELPIALIADTLIYEKGKELLGQENVYTKEDILKLHEQGKNKLKKLAKKYYWFIIKADLMKTLGPVIMPVLGPRSKIPQVVAVEQQLEPMINKLKNTIRVNSKMNPLLQAPIGTEKMSPEDLTENAIHVYRTIVDSLPQKELNVGKVYLKFSMSPSVEVK